MLPEKRGSGVSSASQGKAKWRRAGQAGGLSNGLRGVLVTCHTHRQREASAEALALLRERIASYTAEHSSPSEPDLGAADSGSDSHGGVGAVSIQDEIEAELASLRAERDTLYQTETGIRGCLLIALRKSVATEYTPEQLVTDLFTEMMAGRLPPPRDAIRFTPFAITTHASLMDATRELPKLLEPHFGKGTAPQRWQLVFKKRSCDPSITAREWIPALAALVDARHPVDLKGGAEISVLVEVFRASCGLCVSANYSQCLGFNCQHKTLRPEIPTDIGSNTAAGADGGGDGGGSGTGPACTAVSAKA